MKRNDFLKAMRVELKEQKKSLKHTKTRFRKSK